MLVSSRWPFRAVFGSGRSVGEAEELRFQSDRLVRQGGDEHAEVPAGPREGECVGERVVECHAESLGQSGRGHPQSAQSMLEARVAGGADECVRSEERRVEGRRKGKDARETWRETGKDK